MLIVGSFHILFANTVLQSNKVPVNHEGTRETVASIKFIVNGDDFADTSYENALYIRISVSADDGAKLAHTIYDPTGIFTVENSNAFSNSPINLFMTTDGPGTIGADQPINSIQLIRAIQTEGHIWLRINQTSNKWVETAGTGLGIGDSAPNETTNVIWTLGSNAEESQNTSSMALANIPSPNDDGIYGSPATGAIAHTFMILNYLNTPTFNANDTHDVDFSSWKFSDGEGGYGNNGNGPVENASVGSIEPNPLNYEPFGIGWMVNFSGDNIISQGIDAVSPNFDAALVSQSGAAYLCADIFKSIDQCVSLGTVIQIKNNSNADWNQKTIIDVVMPDKSLLQANRLTSDLTFTPNKNVDYGFVGAINCEAKDHQRSNILTRSIATGDTLTIDFGGISGDLNMPAIEMSSLAEATNVLIDIYLTVELTQEGSLESYYSTIGPFSIDIGNFMACKEKNPVVFGHIPHEDSGWQSNMYVLNQNMESMDLSFQVWQDGESRGSLFEVFSKEQKTIRNGDILSENELDAWAQIESSNLMNSMANYYFPGTGWLARVPMVSNQSSRYLVPHVPVNDIWWTGMALTNGNNYQITVTAKIIGNDGSINNYDIVISANEKKVGLIQNLIPEIPMEILQNTSHMELLSTDIFVAINLIGGHDWKDMTMIQASPIFPSVKNSAADRTWVFPGNYKDISQWHGYTLVNYDNQSDDIDLVGLDAAGNELFRKALTVPANAKLLVSVPTDDTAATYAFSQDMNWVSIDQIAGQVSTFYVENMDQTFYGYHLIADISNNGKMEAVAQSNEQNYMVIVGSAGQAGYISLHNANDKDVSVKIETCNADGSLENIMYLSLAGKQTITQFYTPSGGYVKINTTDNSKIYMSYMLLANTNSMEGGSW